MYVCSCRGVTDRTICALAQAGVCDEEQVAATCGAGSVCGGCRSEIRRLISEWLAGAAPKAAMRAPAAR